MSAARLLPLPALWAERVREGWEGTVTLEHSTTDIKGRAIRHSCNAISTNLGDGLKNKIVWTGKENDSSEISWQNNK